MKKLLNKLSIKIFEYIYKKQQQAHKKRMDKLKKDILKGGVCAGKKIHTASGATLVIDNNSTKDKEVNDKKLEKMISSFLEEPKKFFDYIKGSKSHNRFWLTRLWSINEFEGFIYPKKGFSALYLNLILNKKISLSTPEMFVISSFNVNPYAIAYQFYNWYCYKMNLSGYEENSQKNFKSVFEICETDRINSLTYSEVLGLKSAVRRDIEAIEFVQKLARNKAMSKKNLEKIKQGKTVRI